MKGERGNLASGSLVVSVVVCGFFSSMKLPTFFVVTLCYLSWTNAGEHRKADGTCVIDVLHNNRAFSDTTSYLQISKAAEKVYSTCVAVGGQRTQGGSIKPLGEPYFDVPLSSPLSCHPI